MGGLYQRLKHPFRTVVKAPKIGPTGGISVTISQLNSEKTSPYLTGDVAGRAAARGSGTFKKISERATADLCKSGKDEANALAARIADFLFAGVNSVKIMYRIRFALTWLVGFPAAPQ